MRFFIILCLGIFINTVQAERISFQIYDTQASKLLVEDNIDYGIDNIVIQSVQDEKGFLKVFQLVTDFEYSVRINPGSDTDSFAIAVQDEDGTVNWQWFDHHKKGLYHGRHKAGQVVAEFVGLPGHKELAKIVFLTDVHLKASESRVAIVKSGSVLNLLPQIAMRSFVNY